MATRTYDEMKAEVASLGTGMENLNRILEIAAEMDAYVRSGNVAASDLGVAKDYAAASGYADTAESLGADIVSRDTGKAATKQKQAKRMAGMTGATSPRTRQQTASLLSSASAAPSTLLG